MGAGMKKRTGHFDKYEFLRRQIAKDLRSLFQHRYGAGFPDGDDGREDLRELLMIISLAPFHHERKMREQIKRTASWMSDDEAEQLIDEICDMPRWQRWSKPKELGMRVNLTNAERDLLRIKLIAPADMSDAEMAQHRKARRCAQDERRRRRAGKRPRSAYLAEAASKRPWEQYGIGKRQYYRRKRAGTLMTQGRPHIDLTKADVHPVTRCRAVAPKGRGAGTPQRDREERLASLGFVVYLF